MKRCCLLFFLFFISACESPILNHEKVSQWSPAQQVLGKRMKTQDLYLSYRWLDGPYGDPSRDSVFQLEFRDSSNERADLPAGLHIVHYGWMPDMGHGSADDGELNWISPGVYRSQYFAFNMPGFWQMHFLFYEGSSLVETVIFDLYF